MLSSKDILDFVGEVKPTGPVCDAFAQVAVWMFNREMFKLNLELPLVEGEIDALKRERKLDAIKMYKHRVGCTLMESKLKIEEKMVELFGRTHFESHEKN
jgi:ribosomal protein L7/L12